MTVFLIAYLGCSFIISQSRVQIQSYEVIHTHYMFNHAPDVNIYEFILLGCFMATGMLHLLESSSWKMCFSVNTNNISNSEDNIMNWNQTNHYNHRSQSSVRVLGVIMCYTTWGKCCTCPRNVILEVHAKPYSQKAFLRSFLSSHKAGATKQDLCSEIDAFRQHLLQ